MYSILSCRLAHAHINILCTFSKLWGIELGRVLQNNCSNFRHLSMVFFCHWFSVGEIVQCVNNGRKEGCEIEEDAVCKR